MSYQSFSPGGGASRSEEKLRAIKLPEDLSGLSFLDIGCNEGFFCIEAQKRGAARIVGLDVKQEAIDSAKARAPDVDFRCQTWDQLPDERFDVILMLSALHYEQRPVRLLDAIAGHLKPNGLFILECGVVRSPERSTVWTQRGMVVYHPTWNLLFDEYLRSFGTKLVNKSVDQAGDPVPRFVFHCRPKKPFVLILTGPGDCGKTSLSHELTRYAGQRVSTDRVLSSLTGMRKPNSPILKVVNRCRDAGITSNAQITKEMVNAGLSAELAALIYSHIVMDVSTVVVEGYSLVPPVVSELTAMLGNDAIIWVASNPSMPYAQTFWGEEEPREGDRDNAGQSGRGHCLSCGGWQYIHGVDERMQGETEPLVAEPRLDVSRDQNELERLREDNRRLRVKYQRLRDRRSVRLALLMAKALSPFVGRRDSMAVDK